MQQQKRILNPIQYLSYQAVCLKKDKAKRICINSNCKQKNLYQCGKQESKCPCHYQHKNCPSIALDTFTNKFMNYKDFFKDQIKEYIQRFDKVYLNILKKVHKQQALFRNNYENIIFGEVMSSIRKKIQNREIFQLTSYEISHFLKALQQDNQSFNCGKLSLNQARQLDKKIMDIFQFIQNLYKQKISRCKMSNNKAQKMRSFSSCCFQKSTSTQSSKQQHNRMVSSSNDRFNFEIKKYQTNQNLSCLIQRKSIIDISLNSQFILRPPKIELQYPRSINSRVIQNCSILNKLIGRKIKTYRLIYRASQNEFDIKKFHEKSSQFSKEKGKNSYANLILIKTQFNNVLGAFTQLPILKNKKITENNSSSEDQNNYIQNPQINKKTKKNHFLTDIKSSTFLFSFNLNQKYTLINPQKAISLSQKSLRFGTSDLKICQKAHEKRQNLCSIGDCFQLKSNHQIKTDYDNKNKKIIGNRYGKKFKALEWQYFAIVFI